MGWLRRGAWSERGRAWAAVGRAWAGGGRAWLRRHGEWLWAPLLFVFATMLLHAPVWITFVGVDGDAQWFGWDALETYWPDVAVLGDAMARGEIPRWNPYDRGGYPFAADPQPGVTYPVSWLFAAIAALRGDAPAWLIQAKALLHHALLATLMYAYLRSRGLGRGVAVFGGVGALGAMPIVIHQASNLMWPIAWVPLVWLATDRVVERAAEPGWWRRAAALGLVVAVCGSAGSPPGFFYALLAAAPLGLFRAASAIDGRRDALLVARGVGVAAAITVAMLLVVYLPADALADASPRRVATAEWALEGALETAPMMRGLVSPPAGVLNAYVGLTVLVLGVAAGFGRAGADRGAPTVLLATGLFGLVLSVGDETPILPLLVEHAWGFDRFRIPSRYTLVAALPLVAAAAHGLAGLTDEDARARRLAAVTTGAVWALVALDLCLLARRFAPDPFRDYTASFGEGAAIASGIAALAIMALAAPARWRIVPVCAFTALAFHDATTFGASRLFLGEPPPDAAEEKRRLAELEPVLADARRDWRLFDEFYLEHRPGSRLGVREFRGYPAGDPLEDARYQELRAFAVQWPEVLEQLNVRWVLWAPHHRLWYVQHHLWAPPTSLAPDHFVARGGAKYEARHPAPLVAWYGGVVLAETRSEALVALLDAEEEDGRRRVAVVEAEDVPPALLPRVEALVAAAIEPRRPRASVAGELVAYGRERVAFTIDAPAEGLVILNEAWTPDWRVTVDGRAATPMRAGYLLRGVVVDAGRHVVVWRYAPPGWRWQAGLWLAAWMVVGAAAVSAVRARSSRRSRPSA